MTRFVGDNLADDVANTDGYMFFGPDEFLTVVGGGSSTLTDNAAGDFFALIAASSTITYVIQLNALLRRLTALSGALAADGTNKLLGDAAIKKGLQLSAIEWIYQTLTNPLTSIAARVDRTKFVNNVAVAITSVLANGTNGLPVAVPSTGPNVTKVAITDAMDDVGSGVTTVRTAIVTPAACTCRFYGIGVYFNFNWD